MSRKIEVKDIVLIEKLVKDEAEFIWDHDTNGITLIDLLMAAKEKIRFEAKLNKIRQNIMEQYDDLFYYEGVWQEYNQSLGRSDSIKPNF